MSPFFGKDGLRAGGVLGGPSGNGVCVLEEFDCILAGAGSAGCVIANRLSADPRNRVRLLEGGGRDDRFQIPAGHLLDNWVAGPHSLSASTAGVFNLRPASRGGVHIAAREPGTPPGISPNFLSSDEDRQVAVDGLKRPCSSDRVPPTPDVRFSRISRPVLQVFSLATLRKMRKHSLQERRCAVLPKQGSSGMPP